jgi:hypothetical protein
MSVLEQSGRVMRESVPTIKSLSGEEVMASLSRLWIRLSTSLCALSKRRRQVE